MRVEPFQGDVNYQFVLNSTVKIKVCNTTGVAKSATISLLDSLSNELSIMYILSLTDSETKEVELVVEATQRVKVNTLNDNSIHTTLNFLEERLPTTGQVIYETAKYTADGNTKEFDLPLTAKSIDDIEVFVDGLKFEYDLSGVSSWKLDSTFTKALFYANIYSGAKITIKQKRIV